MSKAHKEIIRFVFGVWFVSGCSRSTNQSTAPSPVVRSGLLSDANNTMATSQHAFPTDSSVIVVSQHDKDSPTVVYVPIVLGSNPERGVSVLRQVEFPSILAYRRRLFSNDGYQNVYRSVAAQEGGMFAHIEPGNTQSATSGDAGQAYVLYVHRTRELSADPLFVMD